MKKLGILLCDDAYPEIQEKHGAHEVSFIKMFESIGYAPQQYAIWNCHYGELPSAVNEADIWLVSGSKWSAYDDYAWIGALKDFIRQIDLSDKKLLGICFGHQIVHEALGGKVQKCDQGWGLGAYPIKMKKSFCSLDENEEIRILAMHQDQVFHLAHGFEVIASCDFCPNAVTTKQNKILTIQAHPEFYGELFSMICERIRPKAGDDMVNIAIANSNLPNDSQRIRMVIKDFLFGA